jgi:hypothetical protein
MTDLIEQIGPILGIVAFLGLALLAFLIIQQAREVRRLREWAGRAPERANEAAEASLAAAEARGEAAAEEGERTGLRGRIAGVWAGVRERFGPRYAQIDRRMPVDLRYLLAVAAAGIVAAAVLTSGFGLFGGGDDGGGKGGGKKAKEEKKLEVAVLNATQEEDTVIGEPITGVPGLASKVADQVVKPAGYKPTVETDAPSGLNETVIMFDASEGGEEASANEKEADKLAAAIAGQLGETNAIAMIDEVRAQVKGAPLALLVGADDADF